MNKKQWKYFKIGASIVRAPYEDYSADIIDCEHVQIYMWNKSSFETNVLSRKICEEEELYSLKAYDSLKEALRDETRKG